MEDFIKELVIGLSIMIGIGIIIAVVIIRSATKQKTDPALLSKKEVVSTTETSTTKKTEETVEKNSSSQSKKTSGAWDNIGKIVVTALIVLGVIVVLMFVSQTVTKCQRSPESNNNTDTPIQKRTMYLFANYPNGIIPVPIKGTAYFYPKGGKVVITSPSGYFWVDGPGIQSPTPPREDGVYLIQKKEQTTLGIEIWN